MIHPDTELRFISAEIGYGVVATRLIPKGTITWVFDQLDRSFPPLQVEAMDAVYKEILKKYSYRASNGNYILCWDNARYVNHSFNSNCVATAYDFELAVRDIQPGEQLTDDYGYLNCEEVFVCLPEPGTHRQVVRPDDLLHFYKAWDEKLKEAFGNFNHVAQPLDHLINARLKQRISTVAEDPERMDSILNCFFAEDESLMLMKEYLLRRTMKPAFASNA